MELIAKVRHVLAVAAAVIGVAFCALAAFDLTESVCRTQGCALFKGTSVYGVSLYWFGAAGFLLLGAVIFLRAKPWSRPAALGLFSLALFLDAGLLGVQALTAACMNCLAVATLLGFMALMVFPLRSKISLVILFWGFFYVAGTMSAAGELLGPVPIYGNPDARTRIFFSPTCPACAALVKQVADAGGLNADAALFAVAKNDEDARRIDRLQDALSSGEAIVPALQACFDDAAPEEGAAKRDWRDRLDSFRNKAFLARSGAKSIPYVFSDAFMFTRENEPAAQKDEVAARADEAAPVAPPVVEEKASEAPMTPVSKAPMSPVTPASPGAENPPAGTGFLPGLIHPSNTCGYAEDTDCSKPGQTPAQ